MEFLYFTFKATLTGMSFGFMLFLIVMFAGTCANYKEYKLIEWIHECILDKTFYQFLFGSPLFFGILFLGCAVCASFANSGDHQYNSIVEIQDYCDKFDIQIKKSNVSNSKTICIIYLKEENKWVDYRYVDSWEGGDIVQSFNDDLTYYMSNNMLSICEYAYLQKKYSLLFDICKGYTPGKVKSVQDKISEKLIQ